MERDSVERGELLRLLVQRIVLRERDIERLLRRTAVFGERACENSQAPAPIVVAIEILWHRRATGLVIRPPGASQPLDPDPKIVAPLGKAQEWFQRLAAHGASNIGEIARANFVSASYVTRVIRLAFLTQHIAQAILQARVDETMNRERLMKMLPLPRLLG